jgi:predicted dehydrogenase
LGELVEAHIRYDRYNIEIGTKPAKEHDIPGSGLFYNLGPHIIDATIALFGIPVKWTKTLGKHRPNTLVDDYAHVHLQYPDDLNVYITASLMVAEERPAFVLNGTKGSFAKMRSDIQESQLKLNMKPNDLYFGIEAENMKGKLTTISSEGIKTKEEITSKRSSYRHILEDVYQSIREGKPYPITEEHIITQYYRRRRAPLPTILAPDTRARRSTISSGSRSIGCRFRRRVEPCRSYAESRACGSD